MSGIKVIEEMEKRGEVTHLGKDFAYRFETNLKKHVEEIKNEFNLRSLGIWKPATFLEKIRKFFGGK